MSDTTNSAVSSSGKYTAAVVTEFGPNVTIREEVLPEPGPNEALVKVVASGICHSDLHAVEGDWPNRPSLPFIPGHEGVGEVVKLGPGEHSVAVGDMIGNAWLWSACGECEQCRQGWETRCPFGKKAGYTVDGSHAEYMLVDTRYAPKIPEGSDPVEVAPILCAGVTVYKGLKTSEVKPGQFVVISGVGGLGHIAVQYAVAMGLRVIAVDVTEDKLDLARKFGAELAVNGRDEDVAEQIRDYTGGGAHAILVTAVHPSAFGQSIAFARIGGTIVFIGMPPGEFPFRAIDVIVKSLTIRGTQVGTRQDMVEALDFYARGHIKPLVHAVPLDELNDVFEDMRHGKIDGRKVIAFA